MQRTLNGGRMFDLNVRYRGRDAQRLLGTARPVPYLAALLRRLTGQAVGMNLSGERLRPALPGSGVLNGPAPTAGSATAQCLKTREAAQVVVQVGRADGQPSTCLDHEQTFIYASST